MNRWRVTAVGVDPDAVDGPAPSQDMAAFHFAHRIAELEARVVRKGFSPRSGDDAVPDHSGQWRRFRLIDLAAPALHAGQEVIHHASAEDVRLVNSNIRCAHGNYLV